MTQISTINEFLDQAGTEFTLFDMGRTIRSMDKQVFQEIQTGMRPAPYPRVQSLWVGITFSNKELSTEHYIWFLKFPLDERGIVMPSGIQSFLQIVVEALGSELNQAKEKKGELPENPYVFQPSQQQLADFNSFSKSDMGLPPSQHMQPCWQYCCSPTVCDWQALSVQGISDLAANLNSLDENMLIKQFPNYAPAFKSAFLVSCENYPLSPSLSESFENTLNKLSREGKSADAIPYLRALSQVDEPMRKRMLTAILASDVASNQDLLAVVAGRHWLGLREPSLLQSFLNICAETDTSFAFFHGIYTDLVKLPPLRLGLHQLLRAKTNSDMLNRAIASLFKGYAS